MKREYEDSVFHLVCRKVVKSVFGKFPWLVDCYCSYILPKQDLAPLPNNCNKTLRQTGCKTLYMDIFQAPLEKIRSAKALHSRQTRFSTVVGSQNARMRFKISAGRKREKGQKISVTWYTCSQPPTDRPRYTWLEEGGSKAGGVTE